MFESHRKPSFFGTRTPVTAAVPSWIAPRIPVTPSMSIGPEPALETLGLVPSQSSLPPSSDPKRLTGRFSLPAPVQITDSSLPFEHEIAHLEQEVEQLREAVALALAEGAKAREKALAESEADLVRLSIAIAERVLGRELETDATVLLGWAKEARRVLVDQDEVIVAVGEQLFSRISSEQWKRAMGVEPVVDPSLGPWHAEVRTRFARVEASLSARLARVLDALEGSPT